ncbi:MAG: hypothetical protein ACREXJ_07600 [Gammaproteobacteria bacterium]
MHRLLEWRREVEAPEGEKDAETPPHGWGASRAEGLIERLAQPDFRAARMLEMIRNLWV